MCAQFCRLNVLFTRILFEITAHDYASAESTGVVEQLSSDSKDIRTVEATYLLLLLLLLLRVSTCDEIHLTHVYRLSCDL